jgi:hypothetical protein
MPLHLLDPRNDLSPKVEVKFLHAIEAHPRFHGCYWRRAIQGAVFFYPDAGPFKTEEKAIEAARSAWRRLWN